MVSTSCPGGDIIVSLGEAFIRGPPTRLCANEFGATLHAAGITESDTQYDGGNTFNGVLLKHPRKPWIEYGCTAWSSDRKAHGYKSPRAGGASQDNAQVLPRRAAQPE